MTTRTTGVALGAAVLLSVWAAVAASEFVGQTYRFAIPDGIRANERGGDFYSFQWGGDGAAAMMMLHPDPGAMSDRMIRPMADLIEIGFEEQMLRLGTVTNLEQARRDVVLGPFKGAELQFTVTHDFGLETRQIMWVLWDGTRAWSGQLTALSSGDAAVAHAILEQARPIEREVGREAEAGSPATAEGRTAPRERGGSGRSSGEPEP